MKNLKEEEKVEQFDQASDFIDQLVSQIGIDMNTHWQALSLRTKILMLSTFVSDNRKKNPSQPQSDKQNAKELLVGIQVGESDKDGQIDQLTVIYNRSLSTLKFEDGQWKALSADTDTYLTYSEFCERMQADNVSYGVFRIDNIQHDDIQHDDIQHDRFIFTTLIMEIFGILSALDERQLDKVKIISRETIDRLLSRFLAVGANVKSIPLNN